MLQLTPDGLHIELVSADEIRTVPLLDRILWCQAHARYTIVTTELIAWLREVIAGRTAIEVGAGQGDLGHYLGIPMSDSYVQTSTSAKTDSALGMAKSVHAHYQASGQAPTKPPPCVERLDAVKAVIKYKPEVVIASWLTHKWKKGMTGGFVYGANEREIVRRVETYIHIGNETIHGDKPILRLAFPHEVFRPPWLLSRSVHPDQNYICVWHGGRRQR